MPSYPPVSIDVEFDDGGDELSQLLHLIERGRRRAVPFCGERCTETQERIAAQVEAKPLSIWVKQNSKEKSSPHF